MKELSIKEKAKAYDKVREKIALRFGLNVAEEIFSEESEDERIRKWLIGYFNQYIIDGMPDVIDWLEKQGEIDKESYEIAEREKCDFVNGRFIDCIKSFDVFKEDNSYWFEYIGNDTYIGRSDNILNQKFHITPKQLYRSFTHLRCPKEDNVNEEANAPTEYGKYVDECLTEAANHFFSEGEDKYSVADLFYAGVRCGKSWLERQGDKNSRVILPTFTFDDILALQCCMATAKKIQEDKELYEQLQSLHDRLHDAYWHEKQCEQKPTNNTDEERLRKTTIAFLRDFAEQGYENAVECIDWLEKKGEQKSVTDFSDIKTWKYIVDAVWTEKEGIGQYLDSPFTEDVAKKLQKRFGNIEQKHLEYPYILGWRKNSSDTKPQIKHSVLMLTTHGVAEGEWLGEEWCQYRWSCKVKDTDVLYWLHLSDLESLEKQGRQKPAIEMKTPEESLGIGSEICNKIVDECIYGKQEPADKVKPKFKDGDWIINLETRNILQIKNVLFCGNKGNYEFDNSSMPIESVDRYYKQWTIQDAKDGDVLYNAEHKYILIYRHQNGTKDFVSSCRLALNTHTFYSCKEFEWGDLIWHPATKEQCDTLMKAIADAGYEWDAEKKELKKIELSNKLRFKVGDLVKDTNHSKQPVYRVNYIDKECYVCTSDDATLGDRAVMHFAFDNPYLRLVEQNPTDKVEPIVIGDFNSVFSREQVKEIDKRIEESQRLYNAKLKDAMRKVEDFPMTD